VVRGETVLSGWGEGEEGRVYVCCSCSERCTNDLSDNIEIGFII